MLHARVRGASPQARVPIPDISLELGRAITSVSDDARALAGLGRCAALLAHRLAWLASGAGTRLRRE